MCRSNCYTDFKLSLVVPLMTHRPHDIKQPLDIEFFMKGGEARNQKYKYLLIVSITNI